MYCLCWWSWGSAIFHGKTHNEVNTGWNWDRTWDMLNKGLYLSVKFVSDQWQGFVCNIIGLYPILRFLSVMWVWSWSPCKYQYCGCILLRFVTFTYQYNDWVFVSGDGDGNMLHYLVEFLLSFHLGLVLGGEFIWIHWIVWCFFILVLIVRVTSSVLFRSFECPLLVFLSSRKGSMILARSF